MARTRCVDADADFPPNTAGGRDLVVGDVHGCFATLESALAELDFDPEHDRLFSLGDLIDYGTRSADALEWMRSRFTATVQGNHESMMLDWLVLGSRMWNEARNWRQNPASAWFPSLGACGRHGTREQRRAWRTRIEAFPVTLTIGLPDGGRVGLVHGYVTGIQDLNWDDLCTRIRRDHHAAWSAMWSRPDMRRCSPTDPDLPSGVPGVDYVCHSHDAGTEPAWTGRNMLCIDTGVHVPEMGHLTLAELRPDAPVLHTFERVDSLLPEEEPRRSLALEQDHARKGLAGE